jgi:hypothetical protein
MSTIYTQHSVSSVYVGPTGHQHVRAQDDDGHTPFALECAACEPYLVKEGWVYDTELVPLTDTQQRAQERMEREGSIAVRQAAERLADAAAAEITKASKPAPDPEPVAPPPDPVTPPPPTEAAPAEAKAKQPQKVGVRKVGRTASTKK